MSKRPAKQDKAPERATATAEDKRHFVIDLMGHSLGAGVAFVFILGVAGGIEVIVRFLIRSGVFEAGTPAAILASYAAFAVLLLDILFLLAVVGKKGWTYLKGS